MIIHTSAVLAILFDEDDAVRFADAIAGADRRALPKQAPRLNTRIRRTPLAPPCRRAGTGLR
jgi:uncharacterized protein with PIN domain